MRKIFLVGLLSVLLSLVACDNDNLGFPSSVNFPRSGGSKIIGGKDMPYIATLEILDYDGDGNCAYADSDSMIVTYKWLTAKMRTYDNKVELIAEPSNSSEKRTLYVYVYDGKDISETKVTQK